MRLVVSERPFGFEVFTRKKGNKFFVGDICVGGEVFGDAIKIDIQALKEVYEMWNPKTKGGEEDGDRDMPGNEG